MHWGIRVTDRAAYMFSCSGCATVGVVDRTVVQPRMLRLANGHPPVHSPLHRLVTDWSWISCNKTLIAGFVAAKD